ncbi:MAG: hypothetical protein OXJ52_09995 [Oligoflexia bacterium]|nr:hypothetical protein [Oligoflexia bacterium]
MSLKRYLPLGCCLPKYQFDIGRRREADSLSDPWTDVHQSNQELSSAHSELVEKLYSYYEKISLAVYNSSERLTSYNNKTKDLGIIYMTEANNRVAVRL